VIVLSCLATSSVTTVVPFARAREISMVQSHHEWTRRVLVRGGRRVARAQHSRQAKRSKGHVRSKRRGSLPARRHSHGKNARDSPPGDFHPIAARSSSRDVRESRGDRQIVEKPTKSSSKEKLEVNQREGDGRS